MQVRTWSLDHFIFIWPTFQCHSGQSQSVTISQRSTHLKTEQICKKVVILGSQENIKELNLCNHLILLIKNYIFQNKTKIISLARALKVIKSTHEIKKFIASKNNKMREYLEKWQPIIDSL
jgi:hypothetical protein